jgi:hypothetical protein
MAAGLQHAGGDQRPAIVVAAEITVESPDCGHLEPLLNAARNELRAVGGPTRQMPWWLTPANGTKTRCSASSPMARRSSSHATPVAARLLGPAGTVASTHVMRPVPDTDHANELYTRSTDDMR